MVFGNSLESLLIAASVAAAIVIVVWLFRHVARRRMAAAQRSETGLDDLVVDLADRSKLFLLALPALYLGLRFLVVPREMARVLRIGAQLALIAQIALWGSGLIDFWLRRYRRTRALGDPSATTTLNVFRIALVAGVWLLAALVAIENLGFNVTTVVASLGIGGVAVALALQNILGDLFASLSIIIDKPFVVGDTIGIDNSSGTVEAIGMKTTRLRSVTGEELIFSNGDLLKSRIHNYARMTRRRGKLRFAVDAETPADKLERLPPLLRGIIERQPQSTFDRAHLVGITDSGIEFECLYYVESPDYRTYADTQQACWLELIRACAAEEIAFAHCTPRTYEARPKPAE